MANCNHKLCRGHTICGQMVGDKKNPGGNIYTPGQLHKHKHYKLRGWPWFPGPLKRLIGTLNNGAIVEIGVFGGASLLGVVETCQRRNTHIYGIDPWEKIEVGNGVVMPEDKKKVYRHSIRGVRINLENIIKQESYDNVTLIHDFSKNAVSQFENESLDIVLVDGDHSYDSVYEDLSLWMPKVKSKGSIWGDDFNLYCVHTAAQDFCTNMEMELKTYTDGRSWSIKKI